MQYRFGVHKLLGSLARSRIVDKWPGLSCGQPLLCFASVVRSSRGPVHLESNLIVES